MKNVTILNDLNTLNKLHTSSVESHTTSNGIADFTCDNAGYIDNVVIEGKTLVNLCYFPDRRDETAYSWHQRFDNRITGYDIYTVIMPKVAGNIGCEVYNADGQGTTYSFEVDCNAGFKVINIPKDHRISTIYGSKGAFTEDEFKEVVKKTIIIAGDHADKPISYFEGLKSVGQGDKIEVLSYNKSNNLIKDTFTYTKDMVINYSNGEFRSATGHYACDNYIEIEPSTDYMFVGINGNRAYYDENKQVVPPINNSYLQVLLDKTNGGKKNFAIEKSPSNARFIRISIHKDNLVDGKACLYKSPNYDHKQIPVTLRSLPNGVKDTIEKRGNKYVKVQRCGELCLDGNSTFFSISEASSSTKVYRALLAVPLKDNKSASKVFCDRFNSYANWELDEEECYVSINKSEGHTVCLKILKSKLENTMTKEKLLEWLGANPTTVVYELETPIITELQNFNPQTYKGENTLIINSGAISCEANFEVNEGIRSELDEIKDKVSSIHDTVVEGIRETRHYPKLQNGWVTNSKDYTPTFVKFGNLVTFNMRIKGGKWSSATIIVDNLPEEFRVKAGHAQVFPAIDLANDKTYNAIIYKEGYIKLYGVDAEPTGGLAIMGTYYVN